MVQTWYFPIISLIRLWETSPKNSWQQYFFNISVCRLLKWIHMTNGRSVAINTAAFCWRRWWLMALLGICSDQMNKSWLDQFYSLSVALLKQQREWFIIWFYKVLWVRHVCLITRRSRVQSQAPSVFFSWYPTTLTTVGFLKSSELSRIGSLLWKYLVKAVHT